MNAYLADGLTCRRVPADSARVFATGDEKVRILRAPLHVQNAFIVSGQGLLITLARNETIVDVTYPFRLSRVSEIPHEDDWRHVIL